MTRDEFIKLLEDNIEPDAKMDFLITDTNIPLVAYLKINIISMNKDIDDPDNKNRAGIVF